MIKTVKHALSDFAWITSVQRHRSRLGWRMAPKYSKYLRQAQRASPAATVNSGMATLAAQFRKDGWAAFGLPRSTELAKSMLGKLKVQEAQGIKVWQPEGLYDQGDIYLNFPEVEQLFQSELGEFLRSVYGTNFKIFCGICYKSAYDPKGAAGSQLWHADGGPGSCINLMWCLSPVSADNGAMECLPWSESLDIFERERRIVRPRIEALVIGEPKQRNIRQRDVICDYYRDEIEKRYPNHIVQPTGDSGLLFAFANNIIHKGGYPKPGHERYVCVFHIYPSAVPTPFDRYRVEGVPKRAGFPSNPAFFDNNRLNG